MVPRSEEGDLLLEREAETAAAVRALDALTAGAPVGGLLVYRGAAGLGKTALLAEVRRRGAERCTVWHARGGETLASVPFHVVRQLLQPALTSEGPGRTRRLLGDRHDVVAPALGLAAPGAGPADPEQVRDGLTEVVARLARADGPLVLVVDDAQWADVETLAWLVSFTSRAPRDLPVLVVVAHRPEDETGAAAPAARPGSTAPPGAPTVEAQGTAGPDTAEDLLAALGAGAAQLTTLRELTPAATAALTRAALGADTDDTFCREVFEVTRGNAYDTVELLEKVRDSRLDPGATSPSTLRTLGAAARGTGLLARLEALGTATVRFARAAAVLGTDIPFALVAQVATMDRGQAAECAERLRAARILTGGDPLEFVHPIVGSTIYHSIPTATRTALHGFAAWALAGNGTSAAAAAPHLLEVHPDGDADVVRRLRQAAAEHLAVGAPDAARRCLERALVEPPLPEDHAEVLYELGCATLLSSPAATAAHLREALDTPGLSSEHRVDAVMRLTQALAHNNQTDEAARTTAQEAERSAPGPARERLTAVSLLWESVQATERDGEGRSRRIAEATAGLTGRDNTERALLMVRVFDATARGENADAIARVADRALVDGRLARGLGWTDQDWNFELPSLFTLSLACADRLDEAEAMFGEAMRLYERSGWRGGHLAIAHALYGWTQRRRGRLVRAEEHLRNALDLADAVGSELPMHWHAAAMLIDTLLARGHEDRAREVAERYAFAPPYPSTIVMPDGPSVRGALLLALGRRQEAVAELSAAGEALTARGRHNPVMAPWACTLATALADEDPARARQLAAYAVERAEVFGTHTAIGAALCCQASLGKGGPGAAALLARAVAHLEESPCAYERASALVAHGELTRRTSDLERGLDLALACGADGLAERARGALEGTAAAL